MGSPRESRSSEMGFVSSFILRYFFQVYLSLSVRPSVLRAPECSRCPCPPLLQNRSESDLNTGLGIPWLAGGTPSICVVWYEDAFRIGQVICQMVSILFFYQCSGKPVSLEPNHERRERRTIRQFGQGEREREKKRRRVTPLETSLATVGCFGITSSGWHGSSQDPHTYSGSRHNECTTYVVFYHNGY